MGFRVFVSVLNTRIIMQSALSSSMSDESFAGNSPRVSASSITITSRCANNPGVIAFSNSNCHVPNVCASYFAVRGQPFFLSEFRVSLSCLRCDSELSIAIMCGIINTSSMHSYQGFISNISMYTNFPLLSLPL